MQCQVVDASLRLTDRVFGPRGSVELAEIGRAWYHHPAFRIKTLHVTGLTATAGHKPHDPGVFAYSAHAAVVAVDPEVGSVEVIDYAIVADCGKRVFAAC